MHFFSKNLRYLRKKGQFNQEEISALFQKRPNTVGNWENQKSEPSLEELIRLAEYFQVTTESLLHEDLELQSRTPGAELSSPVAAKGKSTWGDRPELAAGGLPEGSPEGFWSVLRELRSIHEKLDRISEALRFSAHHPGSDKSSH